MKKFFSLDKFKSLILLYVLEILMWIMVFLLQSKIHKYIIDFDWRALLASSIIWFLSCLLDKERYFNLATLIGLIPLYYWLFYIMFKF